MSLAITRIRTSADNRPTCAFEVEEMVVIQDLILCTCWPCLSEEAEAGEVHVFDLLTHAWRYDVTLPRGDSIPFQPLYSLLNNRFKVIDENTLAFVLNIAEISIQIVENRQFRLAYIIDISEMSTNFVDCINIDGLFYSSDLQRIFFFGENFSKLFQTVQATVDGVESQVGYVRPLKDIERLHIWDAVDSNVVNVVQRGSKVYILQVGPCETGLIVFDLKTCELSIAPSLLLGDDRLCDVHPVELIYPHNGCWLNDDRFLVAGVRGSVAEMAWAVEFGESAGCGVTARWRAIPAVGGYRYAAAVTDQDPFVCSADNIYMLNNQSHDFYRVPVSQAYTEVDSHLVQVPRLEYLAHLRVVDSINPAARPLMNGRVLQRLDVVAAAIDIRKENGVFVI